MNFKLYLKVAVVVFSSLYLILIVTGYMDTNRKLGPSEYALIAFTILFVGDFFDNLAEISFGKEGVKVRIRDMEVRQKGVEGILTALQVALSGMLTKYEYRHLLNLDAPERYMCTYGHIFFDEIKRLDAIGFVAPTGKYPEGFNAIQSHHRDDRNAFDLKEYVHLTDEGKAYLHVMATMKAKEYSAGSAEVAGSI